MENEKAYSFEYLEGVYKTVEKLCLLKKKDFYDYYLNNIKEAFIHILNRKVKNIRDIQKTINDNKHVLDILNRVTIENLVS